MWTNHSIKLEDMKVLDIGNGSGSDCFATKTFVGPNGRKTGIHMSDEQVCPYWALYRMNSVFLYIN